MQAINAALCEGHYPAMLFCSPAELHIYQHRLCLPDAALPNCTPCAVKCGVLATLTHALAALKQA